MSATPPMTAQRRLASYGKPDGVVLSTLTGPQRRRVMHKAGHLHRHPVSSPVRGPEPQQVITDELPETSRWSAASIIGALDLSRVIRLSRKDGTGDGR